MLDKIKKIHFIGIGGIGVSALAQMMLSFNKKVVGSDTNQSQAFKMIKKMGGKTLLGHQCKHLEANTDMLIYSPAINDKNPELIAARQKGIPSYSYPEALGMISKNKYVIAIAGAHGKTTTTAMLAEILITAHKKPTLVMGGILKKQQSNFVLGKSQYFVVEACEYKESFLNLSPKILVITNIDNDHLDYYKNLGNIKKAFAKMMLKVPATGFIVLNPHDKNTASVIKLARQKNKKMAKIIDYTQEKINFKLKVLGRHNIYNTQAALAVVKVLKIKNELVKKALKNYAGVWRRFEFKGKTKKGALIYDDYAHHPTEIKATLKASREYFPQNKIWVIFQPHLYSRTKLLLKDFAKSFDLADKIIITDIYAAREKYDPSIHAKDLVRAINKKQGQAKYIKDFKNIKKYLQQKTEKNNVIITMGAGDIYQIGEEIKSK